MLTFVPGMSRAQLLAVFTTEGGLSTALWRTFVSRDCPFFKIDVTFRRVAPSPAPPGPNELLEERETDVIASVSRPYLQFTIAD
jgi:hypothetical protein